jgi:aryl-alcohol dehydrogenase-like predicted oxidoreductase
MSRRTFAKLMAALPAAGLLPTRASAGEPVFRTLGRTGMKVSEVGMGVMLTSDPDIVRAALDSGINYFDTARAYMGGRNEGVLGKGLKGRRQEAIVATKCHHLGHKERVVQTVEESLRTLGMDHVDLLQLHNLSSRRQVLDEANIEALQELRQAGKVRFFGVTTHSNMVEVMKAAVEARVFDTVLTSYNFQSPAEVGETVRSAAAAGLGVIAMKIMTGGYRSDPMPGLNPYQAALRWVLRDSSVATTIPSMKTFDELEEDRAVMGSTASLRDDLSLMQYAAVAGPRYCRACGSCSGQCTYSADIPTALRGLMYAEGYGRPDMARATLAGAAIPCGDCSRCGVTCRFGLDVKGRMMAAKALTEPPSV